MLKCSWVHQVRETKPPEGPVTRSRIQQNKLQAGPLRDLCLHLPGTAEETARELFDADPVDSSLLLVRSSEYWEMYESTYAAASLQGCLLQVSRLRGLAISVDRLLQPGTRPSLNCDGWATLGEFLRGFLAVAAVLNRPARCAITAASRRLALARRGKA